MRKHFIIKILNWKPSIFVRNYIKPNNTKAPTSRWSRFLFKRNYSYVYCLLDQVQYNRDSALRTQWISYIPSVVSKIFCQQTFFPLASWILWRKNFSCLFHILIQHNSHKFATILVPISLDLPHLSFFLVLIHFFSRFSFYSCNFIQTQKSINYEQKYKK